MQQFLWKVLHRPSLLLLALVLLGSLLP